MGSTLDLGLASLVPEVLLGLEEARLHSFNVEAHRNQVGLTGKLTGKLAGKPHIGWSRDWRILTLWVVSYKGLPLNTPSRYGGFKRSLN